MPGESIITDIVSFLNKTYHWNLKTDVQHPEAIQFHYKKISFSIEVDKTNEEQILIIARMGNIPSSNKADFLKHGLLYNFTINSLVAIFTKDEKDAFYLQKTLYAHNRLDEVIFAPLFTRFLEICNEWQEAVIDNKLPALLPPLMSID